ncbi:MAG TPA: tetratricopeptide repeat protein, partial [Nitrososphaeraceae archaeon]
MLSKKYHFSIFFIFLLLILFSKYLFHNYDYELKYSFAIQDAILSNKTIHYFIKQGDYNFQTIRDFHTAIKWYEKALAIDKNNIEALSNKGEALSRLLKYSEALELVDKALDLEPNSDIALYAKGYTL